jgi:hypothetical protein
MKKFLIINLLFVFTSVKIVIASHAMGSDLTYRCLGPGPTAGTLEYELTFSFYRDCIGSVTPSNPLDIQVTNSCGLTNPVVNLPLLITNQISPICPTASSTCTGGTSLGVEEWIFRGNVVLPGYCSDWIFSHSEGVRSGAITTFPNGATYNLYVFTKINNLGGLSNSSPTFNNRPVPFSCINQHFCFNHGAYDFEGDSLSFEIITPRFGSGPGDTIDYIPGYSANQPVLSNPPMTFNSSTGDFCMNPTQQDISVFALLVNEYRDGILIGQVERDMQIIVQACANNLPALTGFDEHPLFSATACIDQQNCFVISAVDNDFADTTSITWDNSIMNATFTNTGGRRDTAILCWSPTIADTSALPYCFTVNVKDNNCPYIGAQALTYCITVDPSPSCHSVSFVPIENAKIDIKIFPQPATEKLFIEFGDDFNSKNKFNIRIDNILGESIYQSPINEKNLSIDIGEWSSSGIHFVYVVDENKRIVQAKKIITVK